MRPPPPPPTFLDYYFFLFLTSIYTFIFTFSIFIYLILFFFRSASARRHREPIVGLYWTRTSATNQVPWAQQTNDWRHTVYIILPSHTRAAAFATHSSSPSETHVTNGLDVKGRWRGRLWRLHGPPPHNRVPFFSSFALLYFSAPYSLLSPFPPFLFFTCLLSILEWKRTHTHTHTDAKRVGGLGKCLIKLPRRTVRNNKGDTRRWNERRTMRRDMFFFVFF